MENQNSINLVLAIFVIVVLGFAVYMIMIRNERSERGERACKPQPVSLLFVLTSLNGTLAVNSDGVSGKLTVNSPTALSFHDRRINEKHIKTTKPITPANFVKMWDPREPGCNFHKLAPRAVMTRIAQNPGVGPAYVGPVHVGLTITSAMLSSTGQIVMDVIIGRGMNIVPNTAVNLNSVSVFIDSLVDQILQW